MSLFAVVYVAVDGVVDDSEPLAHAPPGHVAALMALVLQMTARAWSPALGSVQPTVNVIGLRATTGSGVSVAVVTEGAPDVTVNEPPAPVEHRLPLSQTNAQ